MLASALAALAIATAQSQSASDGSATLSRLLDRTAWIDIGLGRSLNAMTRAQVAELRKCPEATMVLQKSGSTWVQSFYAGLEMRTVYSSATAKPDPAGTTVLLYTPSHREPAETLRIALSGDVLVEQTRGFRPRTFLKCDPPKAAPAKKQAPH
ncbi:MAG TPA: hypothetical protein VHU18_07015 [Rhizomicrobium sp.]|jgi:hypothetical protein|nr:hypothetical protein [Rhizomicrobium sp.]